MNPQDADSMIRSDESCAQPIGDATNEDTSDRVCSLLACCMSACSITAGPLLQAHECGLSRACHLGTRSRCAADMPLDFQQVQVCAHCGAKRLGRAFVCIKCENPWRPAAAGGGRVGGEGGGGGGGGEEGARPRRSFRVAHPQAAVAAPAGSPPRAASPAFPHAPLSPQPPSLPASPGHVAAPASNCQQSIDPQDQLSEEVPLLFDDSLQVYGLGFEVSGFGVRV